MKRNLWICGTLLSLLIFASGCAGQPSTSGGDPDYDTTKKMVIDMLKSDDGKKAVQDILSDEKFKQQLVMDQDFVRKAIADTLASDQSKKFWEQLLSDPDFSTKLASTMQKNNEKILKQLMKDPKYQESMMAIFKAPDMENEYLELMKTKPFREQIQKEIIETMESPLFTTQITDALQKAVKQQMQQGDSKDQSGGGGTQGTS